MKRLRAILFPCAIVLALAAVFLTMGSGASAASLPQRLRSVCTSLGWSTVSSPNAGTSFNSLNGVAAVSSNNVWAVGSYGNGTGSFPLVEHWNGSAWKVVASPHVSGGLSGIVAIAAHNIWAVGSYSNATTLVEHWNGTGWSIIPSPNVAHLGDGLSAVSAVSATDIWAVGTISGNSGFQTLIEHWNGTTWSIKSSQKSGGLRGVAALAANNVWAVGAGFIPNYTPTLIEHWNGSAWRVVPSLSPGPLINTLNAVAAISANNVWAVGADTNSPAPSAEYAPLIEHWNGTAWSVVTSPQAGTSDFINGIAAPSASSIWVVGDYRTGIDPQGPYFTLIEHWNGTTWSVVTSPSPGSLASDLTAAAFVPATSHVWSVGFTQGSISQTLTERHCQRKRSERNP